MKEWNLLIYRYCCSVFFAEKSSINHFALISEHEDRVNYDLQMFPIDIG